MATLPWIWFDHRTDVPQWVSSGIGRIVIEWSVLERELEELINLLLDVDIQPSRILVNNMGARMRTSTITSLIQANVYNSKLPAARLKNFLKLETDIASLQTKRDMLAHGVYAKRNKVWYVLRLRQTRKTPQLAPDLTKLSRAVIPQREAISFPKLRSIAKEIVALATEIQKFRENLEPSLSPSRYSRLQYSRKRYNYR